MSSKVVRLQNITSRYVIQGGSFTKYNISLTSQGSQVVNEIGHVGIV